jgi:chemosensory pili system protein ChpE
MLDVIASGFLIGLAIALPVGPVITELIRRGLRDGFCPAWLVGLGAAASHAILVSLTLLGVVALLDRPAWHAVLGGAGTIVLAYLGVSALRAGTDQSADAAKVRTGPPFVVGFGIGISNPITLLWFLTAGGALIATQGGGGTGILAVLFGVSFVLGVLSWDTVMASLAGYGRRWMGPRALKALNVIAGLVFFGFAVRLAWRLIPMLR